ncbi:DNA topoisomerase III [Ammoniphilus resinae]|uniref:DNA topoisomerase n=1 Tax=Ammoniphilus resinae TaxID=861532 RepID=A0ABS4GTY9_9BACL|nr:DNA topoisomerase III [Ammoniphilus resinae]MBP1933735.1 DNA topoisomerase-3 [Ammoniphilus resinae]
MKSLVLAEKPSVAKEIARVLGCRENHKHFMEGPNHVVTWALGHLVTLAEPEDYNPQYKTWRIEDLPILPTTMKLKVMKETSHQFRAISQLAKRKDLQNLVIATDAGREGELVARWIMEMIHWKKPFQRLWISSQTDKAIREGFSQLKPGMNYDNLYQSAVCRAEADWLIGLNVTRALTTKYQAQLAAGRVQTPTLAMLVEREKEIRSFIPVPYWTIQADFGSFQAIWRSREKQDQRIFDEETANLLRNLVQGKTGHITEISSKQKSEAHPLAYDLTELQRDANRRYGFSAKQTSNVLQRLYERHKIVTYPRTDSRYLTSDMTATLPVRLRSIAVGPYADFVRPLLQKKPLPVSKRVIDDEKVTDHHAIIPTEEPLRLAQLDNDERKLYDLIARRFIALFYPPYRYESVKMTIDLGGEAFHAAGTTVVDPGWKAVYGKEAPDSDDEEKQSLPTFNKGDQVPLKKVDMQRKLTEPPHPYNEAELLGGMEKHNLGTPATRADIIEKLLQTDTIERRGNRLHPTQKGMQLLELVASDLRSPELTTDWEQELERIARGKGNPQQFLAEIRNQAGQLVREIKTSETNYKPHNLTGSKCPECGEFLLERKGKRGKMLVCSNHECHYRRAAENQLINKRCPQCHKKMELREGKAGKFAQCKSCNVVELLDGGKGQKKVGKREEKSLLKKYSGNEEATNNLGDLLKAALEKKDQD